MENRLTIKELSPYLPYELWGCGCDYTHLLETDNINYFLGNCKPILRPLSDLTKEIEVDGNKFIPIDKISDQHTIEYNGGDDFIEGDGFETTTQWLPYAIIELMVSWHFDVFGLIEKGLAIDINTYII